MYAPFFGLSQEPFSISPDPRFLYMSERHREALAHLLYGLSAGGGFVLLTGEIGAGKTTICRCFLEQAPSHCTVAYIFNPKLTVPELLRTISDEFGVEAPASRQAAEGQTIKSQVDALNDFLLKGHAKGEQAVLVIDEAQSLSPEVLEQLRLLTNLETAERKLLQIILIGQPELRDMLARPELNQLAQRVIARYHLTALDATETPLYIRHRWAVAGPNAALPFDAEALKALHSLSAGVPRRINLLADRALLGAYGQGLQVATRPVVVQAAKEVYGSQTAAAPQAADSRYGSLVTTEEPMWWRPRMVWMLAGLMGLGLLALLTLLLWLGPNERWRKADGPARVTPGPLASTPSLAASVPAVAASLVMPSAASPPLADVSDVLRAATGAQGQAWRELALRWNVAVGEGDPCLAVKQAGLACFTVAQGGLSAVRQLDRPGIVALRATQGATVYAQLVALDDRWVTLQANGKRFNLTLQDLAQVWRGDFSTLWRTPEGWGGDRSPLDSVKLRHWISQRLPGVPAGGAPVLGAEALREKLRVLQMAQGLPTDGQALPHALMLLSRQSGVAEPRLPKTDRL